MILLVSVSIFSKTYYSAFFYNDQSTLRIFFLDTLDDDDLSLSKKFKTLKSFFILKN